MLKPRTSATFDQYHLTNGHYLGCLQIWKSQGKFKAAAWEGVCRWGQLTSPQPKNGMAFVGCVNVIFS